MNRTFAPSLVELEDRTCPTTYRWNPPAALGNSGTWSTPSNWQFNRTGLWVDPDVAPGAGDVVEFGLVPAAPGQKSAPDCIVNSVEIQNPTVLGVSIYSQYTGRLHLRQPLLISDPTSTPFLNFSGSAATIGGEVVTGLLGTVTNRGRVYLGPIQSLAARMEWSGGTLADVDFYVGAQSTVHVEEGANTARKMTNTVLYVDGRLHWEDGNVTLGAANTSSAIVIGGGGRFDIEAGGNSWKGAGPFLTQNHGLVHKSAAGTAELGGDYLSIGTTHVETGVLKHLGEVKIAAGVYKVDANAEAWVRGWTDGLRVYNGELTGGGKVEGNVNLSFDPADQSVPTGTQTNAGTIHPIAGQTLTITGGLDMRSTGAYMRIDFDANGGFSKVVVQGGPATLKGTLFVDNKAYSPPSGSFTFLTAVAIGGDFTTTLYEHPSWYAAVPGQEHPGCRYFHKKKVGNTYVLEVINPDAPPGGGGGGGGNEDMVDPPDDWVDPSGGPDAP